MSLFSLMLEVTALKSYSVTVLYSVETLLQMQNVFVVVKLQSLGLPRCKNLYFPCFVTSLYEFGSVV